MHRSLPELASLLSHSDQRVRQASQFAMVKKGNDSIDQLKKIIEDPEQPLFAKLHSVWGLGQLARLGNVKVVTILLSLLTHPEEEIRANVARVAGSSGLNGMAIPLLDLMSDSSDRVVSLAALSLGRIGSDNTKEIVTKLLSVRETKESHLIQFSGMLTFLPWIVWLPRKISLN